MYKSCYFIHSSPNNGVIFRNTARYRSGAAEPALHFSLHFSTKRAASLPPLKKYQY